MMTASEIRGKLFELSDSGYAELQTSIVPTVDSKSIIGVRIPDIRKLAKTLDRSEADAFIKDLPHSFYDENVLHSVILSGIGDFWSALYETERFLPFIDNWAVCDTLFPKSFCKNPDELLTHIYSWLRSEHTYTVRFGIGMLMRLFLDERFEPRFLDDVAAIRSEEYYVRMMQAWYMATALCKNWDAAVSVLKEQKMESWTHNKSIQKARESFRITPEQKKYLYTLKVKI